jgi:hypothetical protein
MEVRPGEVRTFERVLVAENPDDPQVLAQLADSLELPAVSEDRLPSAARPTGTEIKPVFEEIKGRGAPPPLTCKVRPEDLAHLDFAILKGFAGPGSLTVKKGEQTLFTEETRDDKNGGEIDLSGKADEGDRLTVVFRPEKGPPIVARLDVVPDRCSRQIAELSKRLEGNDPRVLANLKSRIYLSQGLDYAALREAWKVAKDSRDGEYARAVMLAAMEMMNLKDPVLRKKMEEQGFKFDPEEVRRVLLMKAEPQQAE